ncbi:LOW QUALITY PROTEIN: receptor-transporting protein 2-like [Trichomycterus rosablanca]|uniref:LOW QUALITY PROTEIN: receptor-transporting protein 2-like n=1 Tax=Trichomycterus rosablanca TaxID=2290929 RepID=UPI002F352C72
MEQQMWTSVFENRSVDLQDEWTLIMNDSIQPGHPGRGSYQYIRGSFARFRCSLCRRGWPSRRVQVVFHFSLDAVNGRGTVKVRRFKQNCRRCANAPMEEPSFEEENVDVMVEKLMEKIRFRCYGEDVGDSNRASHFSGRVNGPHESAHCEACRAGICTGPVRLTSICADVQVPPPQHQKKSIILSRAVGQELTGVKNLLMCTIRTLQMIQMILGFRQADAPDLVQFWF